MFQSKQVSRDEVMLVVTGSISAETVGEFHRHIDELCSGDAATVTLDLLATLSINSSALGKILLFRKRLAEQHRTLQIRGCSESLFKTFQMIKFDSLISIQR